MPSKTQILKFLDKAKQESTKSTFFKQKVGCVMTIGNKPIVVAHNSEKTYPIQKKYNRYRNFRRPEEDNHAYIHAEMQALQNTKYLDIDWEDVVLYVGRQTRTGEQGLAKPCPACQKAIKERGIGTVYYTLNNDGFDVL